ncbi:MAG: methylenetetrahydrofolate reductase C-terminal domain-containing protein [Dehalococcoidia bacterium]|nr:methylenetetrahydrofolate reductase C-terminal domain-containing protein [Dehalococcoidia bacterium]
MKAITKQKGLAEIERLLEKESSVFLVGCGTCATMCHTGGKDEVLEMARRLVDLGKTITGSVVIPTVCDAQDREAVSENVKAIDEADCILVMACAYGVQTLALYTDKPVYPALDTLFMGQEMSPGVFSEVCVQCGECVLGWTGGICPITACPKGLLNGPCGGAKNGKCEVSSARDCAWEVIYERLSQQGKLDNLRKRRSLRNFSASTQPGVYLLDGKDGDLK